MTTTQIARMKAVAQSASPSTYYTSCPASLTGTVVFIDVPATTTCQDSNNAVYNSATEPGLVIMPRGKLSMKGSLHGLVYMANEQNSTDRGADAAGQLRGLRRRRDRRGRPARRRAGQRHRARRSPTCPMPSTRCRASAPPGSCRTRGASFPPTESSSARNWRSSFRPGHSMSMDMPLALLPAAAFGLLIGSFLNVVAFRVPARMSLAMPASHCPSCETPIKPYDNIPGAVLAAAARAVSQLLGADRRALSARRGRSPRCCSPPSSPCTTPTRPRSSSGSCSSPSSCRSRSSTSTTGSSPTA